MFEIVSALIVVLLIILAFTRHRASLEVISLRKENFRLKNILADLMISNTQMKGMR